MDLERALKRAAVLHQQAARLVGLKEPLVRVQPDRIGALNSMPRALCPASVTIAKPPYAASTCSQIPSASQKSAMASSGSIAPVLAAPALAHTAMGLNPAARSSVTARVSASMSRLVCAEVTRNHANTLRSDTDNHCRAAEYAMALVAHIHGCALRDGRPPPGQQRGRQRLAAAPPAREKPAGRSPG